MSSALKALRDGVQAVITDRYAGDFAPILPKLSALLSDPSTQLNESELQSAQAQAWREGALWAAVECGAIRSEDQPWLVTSDNPYEHRVARVFKDKSGDWVAECCNEAIWCGDWRIAMEAAWGHIAMGHS